MTAARLTELWSRLPLPRDTPEARAATEEAEALRRRLLERSRMCAAADWLQRQPQLGRDMIACGHPGRGTTGQASDVTDLLRACLVAMRVPAHQVAESKARRPQLWTARRRPASCAPGSRRCKSRPR